MKIVDYLHHMALKTLPTHYQPMPLPDNETFRKLNKRVKDTFERILIKQLFDSGFD
ncbi:hypothetical protein [Secundilactobacillus folii]|uniref:Transposase n=1 Tax=Secundilactobacillus folii TaxID=2678357 RepID=A0A7X2XXK3_9LACO|nr:hypothetical protein [Secundilactobacillus folii]MTV82191.1 hypothetical protein [Secundilactobacillus folii]